MCVLASKSLLFRSRGIFMSLTDDFKMVCTHSNMVSMASTETRKDNFQLG